MVSNHGIELAQELRKAKTEEIEHGFYDLRLVTFVVAGIFTLGGPAPARPAQAL